MKPIFLLSLLAIIFFSSCNSNAEFEGISNTIGSGGEEVYFYSTDSIKVYADLYQQSLEAPTIILLHQGGANVRSEYKPIIPKLLDEGFNMIAVDLRVGGQLLGNYNRTVADLGVNRFNYCNAYLDLEASLKYLGSNNFTGNTILWGSSYSASLAIKLAHENPDKITAVLAFSPTSGAPMAGCEPNALFETLKTPMLLLRPYNEVQFESVKNQIELASEFGHQMYIANNGRHGSSMLVEERVQAPVKANWKAVLKFLELYKN